MRSRAARRRRRLHDDLLARRALSLTPYERYGRALLRKAERMIGNRADAQDLVQALFVEMLQKGERDVEPDLPYLYRAITSRCLNFLRDEGNRARLLRETHEVFGTARTQMEGRAVDVDLLRKLARALDDDTLAIVVYRYVDDLTQDEVASLVGLSRKTVGKKLDDARAAVARLGGADA